jgi:hypothetical protein
MLNARASSVGFSERTQKNLRYIEQAFEGGEDVHVVTQVVNSLVGLVVFPWERLFLEHIRDVQLADLEQKGWPAWQYVVGGCTTLGELARFLRNGTSHSHIEFSSDSRHLDEVTIQVSNYPRGIGNDPDFVATIRADRLRDFCMLFAQFAHGIID